MGKVNLIYFLFSINLDSCESCPEFCTACESDILCSECKYDRVIAFGQCKENCPEGFINDKGLNKCIKCDGTFESMYCSQKGPIKGEIRRKQYSSTEFFVTYTDSFYPVNVNILKNFDSKFQNTTDLSLIFKTNITNMEGRY